jgi:hypothetical protein
MLRIVASECSPGWVGGALRDTATGGGLMPSIPHSCQIRLRLSVALLYRSDNRHVADVRAQPKSIVPLSLAFA